MKFIYSTKYTIKFEFKLFVCLLIASNTMRSSKLQKTDKITSSKNIPSNTSKSIIPNNSKNIIPNISTTKYSYHNYTNLTNQQYLLHALKLLGVTETQFLKQTKLSMNDEIFGKNQSASTTKQFFFIVVTCLKSLCNEEEFGTIKMWYPPRTVNEQLQFKKALYNLFAKLQTKNKVPKNLLISKNFLMGQTPTSKIIEFLRILSELSLRDEYLQRFSKKDRLIEICFNQVQNLEKQPNDINRSYVYPFTPGQIICNPPLEEQQIQSLKKVYKAYIEIYRKKILSLAGKYPKQELVSCQQLMTNIVEQKQLAQTLNKKIPKSVLSDNRAFDRRKIIDKSRYVWNKLNSVSCIHFEKSQTQSILKLQGQIDKILLKWETPTGINKMLDIVKMTEKIKFLKENCIKRTQQFNLFYEEVNNQLKKYQQ